jgi:hypothetical protein
MVTVVITSYNRFDLLVRTVESFVRYCDYPVDEFIIIEDSGLKPMHSLLHEQFDGTGIRLILNESNMGAYESIDKVYSLVKTPYVLHIEDDWEFTKGGFMQPAIEVLKNDEMIMQVSLEHNPVMSILPEVYKVNGTEYRIVGTDINGWWHGFTCHPSLRSMKGYEATRPWCQWSDKSEELSQRELKVGFAYHRLSYKAAILNDSYCTHIGLGRCTWHE